MKPLPFILCSTLLLVGFLTVSIHSSRCTTGGYSCTNNDECCSGRCVYNSGFEGGFGKICQRSSAHKYPCTEGGYSCQNNDMCCSNSCVYVVENMGYACTVDPDSKVPCKKENYPCTFNAQCCSGRCHKSCY